MIHELTTNALRHGALSRAEGQIDIETGLMDPDIEGTGPSIRIDWRETGLNAASLDEAGFGILLIRKSLDKVLGANVNLEQTANGIHAHIELPAAP